MSHYDWLEKHFNSFYKNVTGKDYDVRGMIVAHGDKCYSHRDTFEKSGIPFERGVAIYLLTYINPFSKEVRETENGWIDPFVWIINNYNRFVLHFPI